jgi:hypothetical protein
VQVEVYNCIGNYVTYGYTNGSGVYTTTSGLPSGTYYAVTWNSEGYLDELYNNIACPGGSCTVTSGTPISVTEGTTTTGINFGLAPGGRISGTVTDAGTSSPLANVEVDVYDSAGNWVTYGYTNSSGVYTSSYGLPSGTYYAMTWNSQGYLDELYDNIACPLGSCTVTSGTPISVTVGTTTTGVNFGLAAGGRISGTVTDAATSTPLASVSVRIYNSGGSQVTSGNTNSSGVYTTSRGLPSGTYYVRTSNSQGYLDELYDNIACAGSCTVTGGTAITVTAGATTTGIDFGLALGGRISGTVTDAGTGLPLGGVYVYVYNSSGSQVTSGYTDCSGVYTSSAGLPSGTYYAMTWNSQGYLDELYDNIACALGSCTVTSGTAVSVTAGATTTGIDFGLPRGGRISGTVTDAATSAPLASVGVYVYNAAGNWLTYGYTNSSGVYSTYSGLPSGTYYVLTWNSEGYLDELYNNVACPGSSCTVTGGTPISVTVGSTTTGINFGLARGGRISGTVTDAATSSPLARVYVYVYDSGGSQVTYGYTNGSGAYTSYSGLPSGNYYVRTSNSLGYLDELYDNIACPFGSCTVTSGTAISVTLGVTKTGINFGLAPGGRISGTVTDAGTSSPLAGVYVYVYDSGGSQVTSGNTNSSGVYTSSRGLPSGTYYARTSNSQGYLDELYDNIACPGSCTVTSGTPIGVTAGTTTTGINFGLAPGGRISGTVTDAATSLPLANVQVRIYSSSGSSVTSGYTNSSGVYTTSTGLLSGTYYARTSNSLGYIDELYDDIACPGGSCTVTGGTPISVTVEATTAGIDIDLTAGGRISGTVTDAATSLPLADVEVDVYTSTGAYLTYGYTNGSGVYTTNTGLPTGTYYARTYNSQGYIDELYNNIACPGSSCTVTGGTPISVTVGSTTTGINFGLARGGRISGTVTDAGTGAPLASVSLYVYSTSGSYVSRGYTNSSGVYTTYNGLPTGTYYARTSNSQGYLDELYNNLPCPGGSCTVTSGTPISVTAGATTTGINFGLARGGRISGTVTDAFTAQPLASVEVDIYNSAGSYVTYGYTNSSGVYTSYSGLPSGTYYARTWNSQGYLDELYNNIACYLGSCTVTSGTPISVTAGTTTAGINFGLALGGRISGTVTDAGTSLPLAGVYVYIYNSSGGQLTYGYTNSSGVFTSYYALPSGTYYARTSSSLGYIDELYSNIACPGGACTVTSGTPITVTAGATTTGIDFGLDPNPGLGFYTMVPCRVLDTRGADGPALAAGTERTFTVTGGSCGIPATAKAISVNVTVTAATQNGNVRLYPAGIPQPLVSTINYSVGVTRANNATVSLSASGQVAVIAAPSGTVHFILDVNGYYE